MKTLITKTTEEYYYNDSGILIKKIVTVEETERDPYDSYPVYPTIPTYPSFPVWYSTPIVTSDKTIKCEYENYSLFE